MKTSELKALIKECVREVFAEQLQLSFTPVKPQPIKEMKTISVTTSDIPVGPSTDYRELLRQQFESSNSFFNDADSSMSYQPPARPRVVPPALQNNRFADFITMENPKETLQ